jgi:hypothetical protein
MKCFIVTAPSFFMQIPELHLGLCQMLYNYREVPAGTPAMKCFIVTALSFFMQIPELHLGLCQMLYNSSFTHHYNIRDMHLGADTLEMQAIALRKCLFLLCIIAGLLSTALHSINQLERLVALK